MKRSASLDLLRGGAAFAVAIPHYLTLNAPFQPLAEAFAIAGVEVFFVLSGFVLAPQIVDWVVGWPWRNLGVFLARRWMRTIPPYVVALIVIALMTGNLMSANFVRYLLYVENLFVSANHTDFYPVAWSLAVEEWFYVLFAPALFVVALVLKRRDRSLEAGFAILVIVAVAVVRLAFQPHDWDLNVRRVTLVPHRLDRLGLPALSGARAFPGARARRRRRRKASRRAHGAACAVDSAPSSASRSPPSAATPPPSRRFLTFRRRSVWFASASSSRRTQLFAAGLVRGVSFYLGRISYSVYLFHLMIVMALKPMIGNRAAGPAARDLCRASSCRFRRSSLPDLSGRSWQPGLTTPPQGPRQPEPPLRRAARVGAFVLRSCRSRLLSRLWSQACLPATPSWRMRLIRSIRR